MVFLVGCATSNCDVAGKTPTEVKVDWPVDARSRSLTRQAGKAAVVDPSLPITGVNSNNDFLQLSYQRTLEVFGRMASLQVVVPFVDGTTQGVVDGEFLRRNISGLGDARLRFAINLAGAPSMSRPEFTGRDNRSYSHQGPARYSPELQHRTRHAVRRRLQ